MVKDFEFVSEHKSVKKLLNAKEVANFLNISIPFAYQLMRRNEIPTVQIGRCVRVRMEDLRIFVEDRTIERGNNNGL